MVASRFHLENAKPMHTPMETGVQLSQVTRVEDEVWHFPYREKIGARHCLRNVDPGTVHAEPCLDPLGGIKEGGPIPEDNLRP